MKSCNISGADYFFLVLNRHLKNQNQYGYACRFVMQLDRHLSDEVFIQRLEASPYIQLLERTRLVIPAIGIPRWEIDEKVYPSPLVIHAAPDDAIPKKILDPKIELTDRCLYQFDIVHHPHHSTLIFSWHHILMDGFGANRLLYSLHKPDTANGSDFLVKEPQESLKKQWQKLVKAKDFLKDVSQEPLLKIRSQGTSDNCHFQILTFDEDDTRSLKKEAQKYTHGLSETPFYLARIAEAYHAMLVRRGDTFKDMWVPVPTEMRKAGSSGPVVSNRHSLIFFRVKEKLMSDTEALIIDLHQQFMEQVKNGMPKNYASMIGSLRLMPTPFYYKLIKGPNGESLAGMLFSQSPAPDNLMEFLGCKLANATALPPNTTPPGISFQLMKFGASLQLVVQYSERCFSRSDISFLMSELKKVFLKTE